MVSQLTSSSFGSAIISTATKYVQFVGVSTGKGLLRGRGSIITKVVGTGWLKVNRSTRLTTKVVGTGWLKVNRSTRRTAQLTGLTTITGLRIIGRTTFLFSKYIRDILPDYIKSQDSYKDVNGDGFVIRFLSIFGHELNQHYYNKLQDLENEWSPLTLLNGSYLDYIAYQLGDIPNFAKDEAAYRRLLTFIVSIYKVKGRELSFKAILYPAQVKVNSVTSIAPVAVAYDDPAINYDDVYLYDQNCATCSEYDLNMSSSLPLTAELSNKIYSLVDLVEPINAKLRNFIFNGQTVTEVTIAISVDEFGDLIYDNAADPGLILTLTPDGDLEISGPNANRYYINEEGDLIWIAY